MRARPGERLAQIVALWQSGELEAAMRACVSMSATAARLGMTAAALEQGMKQARDLGYAVPRFRDVVASHSVPVSRDGGSDVPPYRDDWDEEPTRPNIGQRLEQQPETGAYDQKPAIGMYTATVQVDGEDQRYVAGDLSRSTPNSSTNVPNPRWPCVEAFDAVGDVPLPALGPGVARSTLIDADGNIRAQWIKTKASGAPTIEQAIEACRAAFAEMPRAAPSETPQHNDEDLLACIAFGDPHFGQLSWHRDSGENFDLEIAERNMVAAAAHLISIAPSAGQCLLIWIGDNTHSDGQGNTTTKGTRVDVDGRTIKMLSVTIRAFRSAIDLSLAKFGRSHAIVERGNHDELLSAVIALALSQFYENDPRVTIDTSPEMYHWFRFGQNLIGTHHGDKAKPLDLLGVMANDRKEDWGATKHRRFYCGHIHHEVVKEVPGLTVEYLRTLAPSDAWHRGQGYRAGRDLRLDVFHREHGLINRHIVGIEQVRALQEAP